jgi:hypothetical protein
MGQWRPMIGDPTVMGWLIVGSYYACSAVAFVAALTDKDVGKKSFFFWCGVSFLMILLAVNKQYDIQSLFTEMGRQIARAQGWMDQREIVQFWFVMVFGASAAVAFLLFSIVMRGLFGRFTLAFSGLYFLLNFLVIRAVSIHSFDMIIQYDYLGVKMNWLFELTGIGAIGAAGFKEILQAKRVKS